jgi:hypothetical protein
MLNTHHFPATKNGQIPQSQPFSKKKILILFPKQVPVTKKR